MISKYFFIKHELFCMLVQFSTKINHSKKDFSTLITLSKSRNTNNKKKQIHVTASIIIANKRDMKIKAHNVNN